MTWKELRDRISCMTEEEQQQQVIVVGEEFSIQDCCLTKLDQDMYYNIEWGESCGEDELTPGDLDDPGTYKICEKGMYYIS